MYFFDRNSLGKTKLLDHQVRMLLVCLYRCVLRIFSLLLVSIIGIFGLLSVAVAVPQRRLPNFATFDHCSFTKKDFARAGISNVALVQYPTAAREVDILDVNHQKIRTDTCYYTEYEYAYGFGFLISRYSSHDDTLQGEVFEDIIRHYYQGGRSVIDFSSITLSQYPAIVVRSYIRGAPSFIEICGTYVAGVFFYFQRGGQFSPIKKYCGTEQKLIRTLL